MYLYSPLLLTPTAAPTSDFDEGVAYGASISFAVLIDVFAVLDDGTVYGGDLAYSGIEAYGILSSVAYGGATAYGSRIDSFIGGTGAKAYSSSIAFAAIVDFEATLGAAVVYGGALATGIIYNTRQALPPETVVYSASIGLGRVVDGAIPPLQYTGSAGATVRRKGRAVLTH